MAAGIAQRYEYVIALRSDVLITKPLRLNKQCQDDDAADAAAGVRLFSTPTAAAIAATYGRG